MLLIEVLKSQVKLRINLLLSFILVDCVFSIRGLLLLSVCKQSCTWSKTVLPFSRLHPQEGTQIMLVCKSNYLVNLICTLLFFNSWDNNEREKMSPWDMEPIPEGSKYVFKNEL